MYGLRDELLAQTATAVHLSIQLPALTGIVAVGDFATGVLFYRIELSRPAVRVGRQGPHAVDGGRRPGAGCERCHPVRGVRGV